MARPLQSLRLRQVAVETLRADADLTAIGNPALGDRIYGRRTPATLSWPFLRVNITTEGPLRKGSQVPFTVHSFSKAQFDDEVETLNAAVQTALEDATLELGPATTAYVTWNSSQTVQDGAEADAWHGINIFTATIG